MNRPLFAYWDESLAITVIRYLGSIVGFGSNCLLLWIIFSSKMRIHQSNWYLALLAVADLIVAFGLFIRATYALYAQMNDIVFFSCWTCAMVNMPMSIGFALTRVAILSIAADRLYMVKNPLRYNSKLNKPLLAFVVVLAVAFACFDTSIKLYRVDEITQIPLCSMGSAQGPIAVWVGQWTAYSCVVTLLAIYIPFLVIYKRSIQPMNAVTFSSSWHWRRQKEVTASTIWLLLLYAFIWGGSYAGLLLANLSNNPTLYAGCITYTFGFIAGMCSSAGFFVYLVKHDEIRRQTVKLARNVGCFRKYGVSRNRVISASIPIQLENVKMKQTGHGEIMPKIICR